MLSIRLKAARKALKLTQEELAKKVKTTKGTISNYENSHSTPSNEMLIDLADSLNTTTDYLLGRLDNPDGTNDINKLNTQNKEISVAGQEITLTPEELKIFEELKKHPVLFHDLATDTEKKIKELIKLQKMKKLFLEENEEEYCIGFGELDD